MLSSPIHNSFSNSDSLKKIYAMKKMNIPGLGLTAFLIAAFFLPCLAFAQELTKQGTSKTWGKIDGVAIEGMVEGPSTEATPLQVACVFEYTEGDIFKSPPALPPA